MKTLKIFGMIALAIIAFNFTSCKEDEPKLPPIGGYNNADEVAAANLVAYWNLDGNGKEVKSSTNPSKSEKVTYVSGVKGQAAKLDGGYIKYPSIQALADINGSITISSWAKLSNTKKVADADSWISPIFTLTGGPNTNIGNVSIFGNTHGLTTSDSIQIKVEYHFKMPNGTDSFNGDCINMTKKEPWMDDTHSWNANKIGGKWAHIVWVWDGETANTRIYVNGVKISNSAWESRNENEAMPFALFTPTYPVIGATWAVAEGQTADVWNKPLTGEVDEIRVYNKLLTTAEIGALYELEKAGR
ncbi:MAG: LamG domain-containing protein [Bacteroidales bacterium]|nr:LamG domain-containing protein [Bacteroidales bacterium]